MIAIKNYLKQIRLFLLFLIVPFLFSCEPDPEPGPNLYDTIALLSNTSTFIQALDIAEFDDDFKSGQFFTVFVPTNDAFSNFLSQNGFSDLNDIPIEDLRQLLKYHILAASTSLSALPTNYYPTAATAGVSENFLAILIDNSGVKPALNNGIEVITPDLQAANSHYNIIAEVLTLPTNLSILRQTESFEEYTKGVDSVDGLADSLETGGPYTLLVVTNQTLESALDEQYSLSEITELETTKLDSLMRFHVVKGNHDFRELVDALDFSYETLLTDKPVLIRGLNSLLVNDQATIVLSDIQTTNGIVHVIDDFLQIRE